MEECKNCEMAIYCYSDSSTWIFRTKQEMDEKQASMIECAIFKSVQQLRTATADPPQEDQDG